MCLCVVLNDSFNIKCGSWICCNKSESSHCFEWPKVESSPFCRDVLKARLSEGHFKGTIFDNVETFEMSSVAGLGVTGLTGGFPCQAGAYHFSQYIVTCLRWVRVIVLCQGCSRAGLRRGLSDSRSSLLLHFFRLWDSDPSLILACNFNFIWAAFSDKLLQTVTAIASHARMFMVLENVSNILSKDLEPIMTYLIQDRSKSKRIGPPSSCFLQAAKKRALSLRWVSDGVHGGCSSWGLNLTVAGVQISRPYCSWGMAWADLLSASSQELQFLRGLGTFSC